MALKDVDIEAALRRLADRKIEEAIRAGKFDNLEGAGKPLHLEPMPANENARLLWWALRILRQNDVIPDEVLWRKRIDFLMDELSTATTEARVVTLVRAINELVRCLNTLGTNALNAPFAPLSVEKEKQRFWQRLLTRGQEEKPPGGQWKTWVRHCARPACRSRNPATARFCRRCGMQLA
jgi:DnaJ homologue, subfamily C, member 28, conserved domain